MTFKEFLKVLMGFVFFVILLIFLLGVFGLSGCKVAEKAVKKYKDSSEFPADCAAKFPPKVTQGKSDTVVIDGVFIDCDSVVADYEAYWSFRKQTDTVTLVTPYYIPAKKVQCPPSKVINRTDTVISTAALEACERKMQEQRVEYEKEIALLDAEKGRIETKMNRRTKHRNYLFFAFLALAGYTFRPQIAGFFRRKKQNNA